MPNIFHSKKIGIVLLVFMSFMAVHSQTTTENYIKSTTYQVATTSVHVYDDEKIENITYFDGLGRTKQRIDIQAGGNKEDIITHMEYDDFGRQVKEYLPYARQTTTQGAFIPSALQETQSFYNTTKYEHTLNPYSEKHLESSPLGRVLEQAAPGNDWALDTTADTDHTIKFEHQINTTEDYVKKYRVDLSAGTDHPQLMDTGEYAAGQLYKTITKDENWKSTDGVDKTTEEYKNKQGQVILKRTFNENKWHDTYYVYDDYGNLTYVLPPKMTTYVPILQQNWIGTNGIRSYYNYDGELDAMFANGVYYPGIILNYNSDTSMLQLTVEAWYNSIPGTLELTDGFVFNLGLTGVSNMFLGDIFFDTGNKAGSVSLTNGALHFTSTGISEDQFRFQTTIDLSGYSNLQIIDQAQLNDLGYQYRYDNRNRLIYKKIPGKGWESIVYNTLDLPVLTQDSNLVVNGQWLFTKYDVFGRVAYTGISYNSGSATSIQGTVDASRTNHVTKSNAPIHLGGATLYYNNFAYPTNDINEIHTIQYYDTYTDLPSTLGNTVTTYYDLLSSTQTKGLPTVSKVRVLDVSPAQWITTVTYYDDKARPIYVYSHNEYLETTDIVETKYDFVKVLETKTTHQKTGQIDIVTFDYFEYDHTGRVTSHTQQINNQDEELIAKNQYDELGQLVKKDVGGHAVQNGFTDLVGVSVAGHDITKTAASNGWNNAGLATNGSFSGDGYIEFQIPIKKSLMVGLSSDNSSVSYNTIDYAIYVTSSGNVQIYEAASGKGNQTTYQEGDIFKVERIGSTIYYKKNEVVFYTSSTPSTGDLLGDISIYTTDAIIKDLHIVNSEIGLQHIDYTYNIRGWLKSMNDPTTLDNDLFSFGIHYNTPSFPSTSVSNNIALYNGNISHTYWRTNNTETSLRHYTYTYDDLNRLLSANYAENAILNNKYRMYINGYDRNGNIEKLVRFKPSDLNNPTSTSATFMDDLTYRYDGNRLMSVSDTYNDYSDNGFYDHHTTGDDYTYDSNGNMLTDFNKGIGQYGSSKIVYNHLNLPTRLGIVSAYQGDIEYTYDATGGKLEKKVIAGPEHITQTVYAGNYVYQKSTTETSPSLQFFNHPEGYVEPKNSNDLSQGFKYVYQYKDHLGNVRLSYTDSDNNGTITGEYNYVTLWEDGFETASGWDGTGASWGWPISGFDNNLKRTGNYSGMLEPYGNSAERVSHSTHWEPINNSQPTDYIFSGWVYLENVSGNQSEFFLMMKESGETAYATSWESTVRTYLKGQWVYLEKRITVPTNIIEINFRIDNNYDGKVWFDDLKIVRVDPTNNSEIVEENSYYPFGLQHKGFNASIASNSNSVANKFKYNGVEYEEGLKLNLYEMDVRSYDPAIARFNGIDPVTHYSQGTSVAFDNNPIYWADPSGADAATFTNNGSQGFANVWQHIQTQAKIWSFYEEEVEEEEEPDDWYEILDANGKGTGKYEWFEGSFDIEGYKHINYDLITSFRDINNVRTTIKYDGDTKSSFIYNNETGEFDFLKSYDKSSYISSFGGSLINPILNFGDQFTGALVNGFQGVGILIYEGVANGRDFGGYNASSLGYEPVLNIESTNMYNNGKWIKVNTHSRGESEFTKKYAIDTYKTLSKLSWPDKAKSAWEWLSKKLK